MTLLPTSALLWVPGLVWLLRRERWRWLGLIMFLFFFGLMLAQCMRKTIT